MQITIFQNFILTEISCKLKKKNPANLDIDMTRVYH